MSKTGILNNEIKAVNIGASLFADALEQQNTEVTQLDWRPPKQLNIDPAVLKVLDKINRDADLKNKIEAANERVIDLMQNSDPYWIGMKPAIECVPGLPEQIILHSGPSISWDKMCDTQKAGCANGAMFEGLAASMDEAFKKLESGEIEFASGNDYHIVVPGSGIATPSMVVNIVEDRNTGICGFCAPFEGPNRGGLAGWGIFNEDIKKHLELVKTVIAPGISSVLDSCGGMALKRMIVRGVEMGDELHSRQDACGLILTNELVKLLIDSDLSDEVRSACIELLYGTVRFFHPLGMASAMCLLEGVRHIEYSTVVTAMEGNGVEYGIKIAGTGNQWNTAPSPKIEGSMVASDIDEDDVLPWIGDSCMLEAVGLGGSAAAAAPAVMRAQDCSFEDGIERSRITENITLASHRFYLIPALNYQGSPLGIDARRVMTMGIEPFIHGGMISKTGKRLGAGAARVPFMCFEKAIRGFAEKYNL